MENKNINDEILKLAGSIDGFFSSFIEYKTCLIDETSSEKLKKAQISFIKSLIVDEKNFNKIEEAKRNKNTKSIPKATSFLFSTGFLKERLSKYNNNLIVKNFKYRNDISSHLSLSEHDLIKREFSDEILNQNSVTELWAKIMHWSNKTTKSIDAHVNSNFSPDEIKKFKKYFDSITDYFGTTSKDSNPTQIINELKTEKLAEKNFSIKLCDQLNHSPRLVLEHFTECREYANEVGLDEAVNEFSDYFEGKSDYKAIDDKIKDIINLKNHNKPLSDSEYEKFYDYFTLELRIMRAYQIKSVAASEMILENFRDQNFPVYYREDPEIKQRNEEMQHYPGKKVLRQNLLGILLPQYSEPIEIHCSNSDLVEIERYVQSSTSKRFEIPKTDFKSPFKPGLPFRINEDLYKKVSSVTPIIEKNVSLTQDILDTRDFLMNSFQGKVNIKYKENKVR